MPHAWNHEEPVVVFDLVDAAHRIEDALVILDAAAGRNLLVRPPMVLKEFSAVREERFQIRIHRVNHAVLDFVYQRHARIEVQHLVIPLWILKHHELVHPCADAKRLRTAKRGPSHLAAELEPRKNFFFSS